MIHPDELSNLGFHATNTPFANLRKASKIRYETTVEMQLLPSMKTYVQTMVTIQRTTGPRLHPIKHIMTNIHVPTTLRTNNTLHANHILVETAINDRDELSTLRV